MRCFIMVCAAGLLGVWPLMAQTESDERALLRVSNGISFSRDSLFLLNLRFRMQNRLGVRTNSLDDWSVNQIEARIRRLRLRFDGFVGNPNLQYYIQLSFSKADQDLEDSDEAKIIRDAIIYYNVNDNFYLGFGQSKLPGNRQRVTSSGNLQFADRSIANRAFTIDRDFGIFAYYTRLLGPSMIHLKAAISTGEGRNISRTDGGLAYTARAEWLPFGDFTSGGDYSEGDLLFEALPKLSLAATYSNNQQTRLSGGQLGQPLLEGIDLTTWIADAMFKWQGHAVLFEWMQRRSNQITALDESGAALAILQGRAVNLQYSFTTRRLWEGVVRYSHVTPSKPDLLTAQQEILLGVNRYLNKHRIKCQFHLGYNSATQSDQKRDWLSAMFQVEFGI